MKKYILLLLMIFLSAYNNYLKSQEANLIQNDKTHRYLPVTLKSLLDTATTNELKISIEDIQQVSGNYVDLYYIIYAKLYYETTDIDKATIKEEISFDATIEVDGTEAIGNSSETFEKTLNLSINSYQDQSRMAFSFNKERYSPYNLYEIQEVSVQFESTQIEHLDTAILGSVFLELYVDIGRYSKESNIGIDPKFYSHFGNENNDLKLNEAAIKWNTGELPCVYEIEWIHIPANNPSSVSTLDYDFTKNAVRTQTSNEYLPISLFYTSGFLVVRGRSKRPLLNKNESALLDQFEYSAWNLDNIGSISVSDSSVIMIDREDTASLAALNWQYTSTYAKDSKKKEIVNYFDGTQRKRQSNTLLNDFTGSTQVDTNFSIDNKSTVINQENYYDYNGNLVIEMLPSPVIDAYDVSFQTNLNTFGSDKLIRSDYDSLGYDSFPQLNKQSRGATQYYSDSNKLLGIDEKVSYIADAEGYAYRRMEYLKDGSGRLKTQYGEGLELAKDETKNTQYFYAKPTTSELESLFGTNIGKANFYKKNISIDPNGVMNIAYIDNKDRTVATSVAGNADPRSKMEMLPTDSVYFTEDLINTGAEQFYESTGSFELSYPIFATTTADYLFNYGFDIEPYEACTNVNICFDCRYSLTVQILDEENNLLLEVKDTVIEFTPTSCNSESYTIDDISFIRSGLNASLSDSTIQIELVAKNQYTINKKLSILKDSVEVDAQTYLDSSNCGFYELKHFQNVELNKEDFTICDSDYSYNDPCKEIETSLKEDFSYPDGKFVEGATKDSIIADYVYNQLLKVTGCHEVETLSRIEFRNAFNDHFDLDKNVKFYQFEEKYIDYLIHFHPTYCQLPACRRYRNESSLAFDEALEESETLAEFVTIAKGLGVMDATDSLYFDTDSTIVSSTFSTPSDYLLFEYDSTLKALKDDGIFTDFINTLFLADSISYYSTNYLPNNRKCNNPNLTTKEDSFLLSYFQKYNYGCSVTPYPSGGPFGIMGISKLIPGGNKAIWDVFKVLYLNAKNRMINDLLGSLVCFQHDYTDTCVAGGDYRFPWLEPEEYLDYEYFVREGYRNVIDIDDLQAFVDSIENEVTSDVTIAKQVYALLLSDSCILVNDSSSFVNDLDASIFMCDPFEYLDTLGNYLICDSYQINLAYLVSTFRRNYPDTVFTCTIDYKETYDCDDYNNAHIEFISEFGLSAVPEINNPSIINLDSTNQQKYAHWVNYYLGLNLSFRDYYEMSNSCTETGEVSHFNDTVQRDFSPKELAIKTAALDSANTFISKDNFFPDIEASMLGSGYTVDETTDYLELGEVDLANSQYDLFYLENGKLRHDSLLDSLNWVFSAIEDSLKVLPDIEDFYKVNCSQINIAQYKVVANATNILIDRSYRYSNGTIWVRLLNASDSTFYNDYYYHTKPNNKLYRIGDIIGFDSITPVFDQEELHYIRLRLENIGVKMLASTSSMIAKATRIGQVELNDYQSMGEFPLIETCEDRKYFNAKIRAKVKYKEYLQGIKDTFKLNYVNFCTNRGESNAINDQYLKMHYESSERHYTLYYYDQADNLVMTVPPDGVDTSFIYNQTVSQNIESYRDDSYAEISPSHTKKTTYKYNSDNQIIERMTPNDGTSKYWYDASGRIALSQNSKQAVINKYAYSFYDAQSRIVETGEVTLNELAGKTWEEIHAILILSILDNDDQSLDSLIMEKSRNDVKRTFYDSTVLVSSFEFEQKNLRSRVATQAYYQTFDTNSIINEWEYATHFSYDVVGNVKSILNDYYQNDRVTNNLSRFKRIDYAYDVVSGNVIQVYYQTGQEDAFYHRYEYDAENRIKKVETSRDGLIWDEDANYEYYLHGPLARTVLGEHKVQGIDYAYTLQGWIKSVNGGHKNADIGNDSEKENVLAEDAFGYAIQYNQNDYKSIGDINSQLIASNTGINNSDLYNGNISAITLHRQDTTYGKTYRYDQINRIIAMNEREIVEDSLIWGGALANENSSYYDYDPNGNLTQLQRVDGESGEVMDQFTYNYIYGKDQLGSVDDTVSAASFPNDIDQQQSSNYSYDNIGNLVSDSAEGICQIRWYPNGKIKRIIRDNPSRQKADLAFKYDAFGNRIKKTVSFTEDAKTYIRSTYYVRDAQGNVMATYEERDCDYFEANDSLGQYYYQYTETYGGYTQIAIDQTYEEAVFDHLLDSFIYKTELLEEAYLNLNQIPNIRDTILSDLVIADYLTLYPDAVSRVIDDDPITYANDLLTNEQTAFANAMNLDNEAWMQYMLQNSYYTSFYNNLDALYTSTYGTNTEADKFFEINKDGITDAYNAGSTTLTRNLLEVSASQYSTLLNMKANHPLALNTMLGWFNSLQTELQNMNNSQPTYDLIDQINAALLFIGFNGSDLSYILQGINNQGAFYSSLGWLPTNNSAKLNSVMYHCFYIGSGTFSLGALNNYAPTASMDWSADTGGSLLKYLIKPSYSNASVIALFNNSSYYNTSNLTSSDLYFINPSTLRPYALTILNNSADNVGSSFGQKIKASLISLDANTLSILDETESTAQLMNYYKNYLPGKVILQNIYFDNLGSAMSGFTHMTPLDYAKDLMENLSVNFGSLGGCSPHQVTLLPMTFELYGNKRLGIMDAKKKRKDEDNLYSRKLGAKEYELSDHLGNVVATVSDKKLHPQELVTSGQQSFDATIGYQPEVTGRFDYYPFGMEIQSRSGSFTTIDYTQNTNELIYDGLLYNCSDYSTTALEQETCSTATNLYGQKYVTSYSANQISDSGYKIELYLRLSKLIPNLDDSATYQLVIELDQSRHRPVTATIEGGNATVTSPNGTSQAAINEADEKLITFNQKGYELANSAYNGVITVDIDLDGALTTGYSTVIDVKNIKIIKINYNENVPLAMREGKLPTYGFQSHERLDEVSGSGNWYTFGDYGYNSRVVQRPAADPLKGQFPGQSPYSVFNSNPINFVDPTGMAAEDWEPEIDEDGNTSYVAEEGDNALTFKKQYGLSTEETAEIFVKSDLDKSSVKSVDEGTTIKGSTVKDVTGNDVLKMDWQSSQATDSRMIDQVLFGMEYSKESGLFSTQDFFKNIPYLHNGETVGYGGAAFFKGTTSKISGKDIQVQMMLNHRSEFPMNIVPQQRDNWFVPSQGMYFSRYNSQSGASHPTSSMWLKFEGKENMKSFSERFGFEFSGINR